MKILLVEDDESLITVLTRSLTAHNYVVDAVKDGEAGWNYGSTFEYDLIVMDIQLPKLDGISLCQRLRGEGFTTPILLLTSQDTSTAKVQGLNAGADDYVVKPFDGAELIARIRALLRRSSSNPLPLMMWGDLLLNPSTCEVTYNRQLLMLTTKEYRLLEILLSDSQHVLSSEEILDRLWSSEEFPAEATVRSHIRRLRHKLVEAGAPHDFIATVHGRGYYLKAPNQEPEPQSTPQFERTFARHQDAAIETMSAMNTVPSNLMERAPSPSFESDRPSARHNNHDEQQAQYLELLNEIWLVTKPQSLDQITVFFQVVQGLQADALTPQLQAQAHQAAHKLAGTIGTFGLIQAMQLARQLERLLGDSSSLQSQHAPQIEAIAIDLQQEIENTNSIQSFQLPAEQADEHLPLLLAIAWDTNFAESLTNAAKSSGLRIAIAPTLDMAKAWLAAKAIPNCSDRFPHAILLQLPPQLSGNQDSLTWLQMLTRDYPDLPILMMGDRGELSDRLEVVRRGGKLFLEKAIAPEQAISTVVQLLRGTDPEAETKVMIVDGDRDWLKTLPIALSPWGLKVTTLAEPEQFWTVLQAVIPDVLVLEANMPQIDGFELCQVVRSDPSWWRLPILFLSELSDRQTQYQAFRVGADDYLCKPIVGVDLANRILTRLRRSKACASFP
jgi:DNA-binding response OmpR family regulator/HPt (histidine-containing phosphotransfer) domain-containing protein